MLRGRSDGDAAMDNQERIGHHQQPATGPLPQLCDRVVDFSRAADRNCRQLQPQPYCDRFERAKVDLVVGIGLRIEHDRDPIDGRRNLFEHVERLSHH